MNFEIFKTNNYYLHTVYIFLCVNIYIYIVTFELYIEKKN